MDYNWMREFADSWALLAMALFFVGTVEVPCAFFIVASFLWDFISGFGGASNIALK